MAYQPKSYRKFVATAATATLVASAVTPAFAAPTQGASENFTDVPARYKEAVDYLVGEKITIGETPTTFGTQNNIKRVDVAVMVARATLPAETIENAPLSSFTDVPNRARLYVDALKAAGFVNGKSDTKFDSEASITRGEAALLLSKAYKLETKDEAQATKFTDVSPTGRYAEAIEMLVDNGIASGKTDTRFGVEDAITRGELALMLHRLELLSPDDDENEVDPQEGIKLSAGKTTITANGADNTVITAQILDEEGNVDKDADNLVLAFNATYGSLANSRVTVQDGVATVVLTSEFSKKEIESIVSARLIEAGENSEWADQIGNLYSETTVKFNPVTDAIGDKPPVITAAESNSADRVTVFFDQNVNPSTFLAMDENVFLTDAQGDVIFRPDAQVSISQPGEEPLTIRGVKSVPGNLKALEFVLGSETTDNVVGKVLTDNKEVEVEATYVVGGETTTSEKSFILTDARTPELTDVEVIDGRNVELVFSEPIDSAAILAERGIQIDGATVAIAERNLGGFDQNGSDLRHTVRVKTADFLKSGTHSVQVSGVADFAGRTDNKNITSNQTLDFEVPVNNTVPAATVEVESPEQIRVKFNTPVSFEGTNAAQALINNLDLEVQDEDGNWIAAEDFEGFQGEFGWTVEEVVDGQEYVLELDEDWTQIFNTNETNDNYYNYDYRLVLAKDVVENQANGKKNKEQTLDLNYSGSALNGTDTKSPQLVGAPTRIMTGALKDNWYITFDEPVKDRDLDEDNTPSELQGNTIPKVVVEFIGTDKDGKKVTVPGTVVDYYDDLGKDNKFLVRPNQVLQGLVDENAYEENWQLVVRNVTDDVGNAATTLTSDFTVTKSPASFLVKNNAYDGVDFVLNGEDEDQIVLDFTSPVRYTGNVDNALNLSNYTLNGLKLPDGSIAKLDPTSGSAKTGYDTVIITLPDNTLKTTENTINISKSLLSAGGIEISGLTEISELPINSIVDPVDPEGIQLSELPAGSYEIQDNTVTDTWGVVLTPANLPASLQGADSYTITVEGKEYTLTQNRFNPEVFSGQVSSVEHTRADVEAGIVEKVVAPEAPSAKLSELPAGSYEIQDNTVTDTWGVVLTPANLPADLQGADGYVIEVEGVEYELTKNRFNPNVFSGQVSSVEHTRADVEAGVVTKK